MNTFITVLKKWKDFSGRSRRSEFWVFYLIIFVIGVVQIMIDIAITATEFGVFEILSLVSGLIIFTPFLAVSVRRLHDTGRSGLRWYIDEGWVSEDLENEKRV